MIGRFDTVEITNARIDGQGLRDDLVHIVIFVSSQSAYEMNAQPLPTAFGAPLRLRLEGQLGYKMVKWIRSMELIGSYDNVGLGYGGWRADRLHYSRLAPI